MFKLTNEQKVGALVLAKCLLIVGFARLIGVKNPFDNYTRFFVTYEFAGGIEVGSPVRVSGIKVGKVDKIRFFEAPKQGYTDVPIVLEVSVKSNAVKGIKSDSQFYVNMAGIIGERYLEIVPGSSQAKTMEENDVFVGIDPPRIDQLISQSFNLAGKILEIVKANEGDFTQTIEGLAKLSKNFNEVVNSLNKSKIFSQDLSHMIRNFDKLSTDLIPLVNNSNKIISRANSPQGAEAIDLLYDLLMRLKPLDAKAISKFFQEEGIRTKLF